MDEVYTRKETMKITAETSATDALKMSKKVADVFNKYGLVCIGCKGLKEEKIGRIAFNQGLDPDKFIADLNAAIEQVKK